ncbi:hypothetical protein M6I34_18035 [Burkholderiaceae bacterium FT117]|uniref:DUF7931 domain-containing protein n=1 Tax=Zeimonas sediminis TaxID=2944268 RepID=UPI002342CD05|nr:hypothetical protein [Zeimonas sediminis]MCM5572417.1 hypothetical protein [Zeimonas sediminis]
MDIDPIDLQGYRRLEARGPAREAFDRCLARARRSLRIFDDNGEFWGLERKAFADAVKALLDRDRDASVAIVLHDTGFVERHCPRLLALLGTHAPRLRIAPADPAVRAYERGFVVVDDTVVLRRPSFGRSRAFLDFDEAEVAAAGKLLDELLDGALPSLSVNVTGL